MDNRSKLLLRAKSLSCFLPGIAAPLQKRNCFFQAKNDMSRRVILQEDDFEPCAFCFAQPVIANGSSLFYINSGGKRRLSRFHPFYGL
jgi:hypothetical protein